MIFFKFLIFITFVCFSNIALADNHEKKKEVVVNRNVKVRNGTSGGKDF